MTAFRITALPPEGALYRFKVRAPEGSEIVGRVEWVPEAMGPAEDPGPPLRNPCWGHGSGPVHHEGIATAMVDAPGHDGKKVRFAFERRHGGRWAPYATLEAPVKDGRAQVDVDVRHPGKTADAGEDAKTHTPMLRFRATLV